MGKLETVAGILGAGLVAAGIGVLAYLFFLRRPRAHVVSPGAASGRWAARAAQERQRRWRVRIAMALSLVAIGVALVAVSRSPVYDALPSQAKDGSSYATDESMPDPHDRPRGSDTTAPSALAAYWTALGVGGLGVCVGVLLLLAGKTTLARGMGAAALVASMVGEGRLINEVSFGDLFKFETKVDKMAFQLDVEWRKKLAQLSEFGPSQLAVIDHFELGKADILPEMKGKITQVCDKLQKPGTAPSHRLLMIIGSADRVPLAASTRKQYDSNVGLARARAEQVKSRLLGCGIDDDKILTLVAGPRNTPVTATTPALSGFPEDRSVVIWALWNVPLDAKP